MTRFAYSVFCDDIRNEINNKISMMGIFGSLMYLQTFPSVLPKLCAVITVSTPADKLFQSVSFKGTMDGNVIFDISLDEAQITEMRQNVGLIEVPKVIEAKAVVVLSPLHLSGPTKIHVTVVADGEEIECSGLQISQPPEGMTII
ncbi:DUF6941 family protein [Pseudomonas sp. HS6-2]|uniref:DUF6941 family protein n=1 Tax=Pseudomonas sp. HS6-2 TaxID=3410986 RepID=UPI003BBADD07